MKRVDIDTNDEKQILNLFNRNILGRKESLFAIIDFINKIETRMILNIDGGWGTGKTVFLKQFELLSKDSKLTILPEGNGNRELLKSFQNKYSLFYFNSWEHDLYNNPLESLIFELMMNLAEVDEYSMKLEENKKELTRLLKRISSKVLDRVIKKITKDLIEFEDFSNSDEDKTPIITSIDNKKESIDELRYSTNAICKYQ